MVTNQAHDPTWAAIVRTASPSTDVGPENVGDSTSEFPSALDQIHNGASNVVEDHAVGDIEYVPGIRQGWIHGDTCTSGSTRDADDEQVFVTRGRVIPGMRPRISPATGALQPGIPENRRISG